MQLQKHSEEATIQEIYSPLGGCKKERQTKSLYLFKGTCEKQQEGVPIYALVEQAYASASKEVKGTIVSDRRIHGGAPCFRGTRIPVYMIIEMYAQGMNTREVRKQYPKLSSEMIKDALIFCSYLLGR